MFKNKFPFANSIRFRIIAAITAIFILVTGTMVFNNLFAVKSARNQAFSSNSKALSLFAQQLDDSLEYVEKYLASLSISDTNIRIMENANEIPERYVAQYRMNSKISEAVNSYSMIDGLFIYSKLNETYINAKKSQASSDDANSIKKFIVSSFSHPTQNDEEDIIKKSKGNWIAIEINGNFYLTRILLISKTYVGAWVNVENIIKYLGKNGFGNIDYVLLAQNNGNAMGGNFKGEIVDLSQNLGKPQFFSSGNGEKFMVVAKNSTQGKFSLVAMISDKNILKGLDSLQKLIFMSTIIIAIFIASIFLIIQKSIILPLNNLFNAMKKLKSGDFSVRLSTKNECEEILIINQTFDEMVNKIEDLKIKVYEEKIYKQRAQLQFLQLQSNPHFYINCLNIIHSLAITKNFALIEKMAITLANHMRYSLAGNETVSLEDEMNHVKNYLELQEIRFPNTITVKYDIDSTALDIKVPPLIIQTFVENTIKYEIVAGEQIEIFITIKKSLDFLNITIIDTGEGFPQQYIPILMQGKRIKDEDGKIHIGIYNITQRLKLMYQGRALINFSNEPGAGARIDISIPMDLLNNAENKFNNGDEYEFTYRG
ncbi:MAG: histidine kinase [Oscillospiraceae bacterium]|nr:histidine kinase [Oscillospiraceae bacterium]